MRKSKDSGFLLFLWNREYVNEKITSWHVGPGLQLPSPMHHTGDFFVAHYINVRNDCQKKNLPSERPGWAFLWIVSYAVDLEAWFRKDGATGLRPPYRPVNK